MGKRSRSCGAAKDKQSSESNKYRAVENTPLIQNLEAQLLALQEENNTLKGGTPRAGASKPRASATHQYAIVKTAENERFRIVNERVKELERECSQIKSEKDRLFHAKGCLQSDLANTKKTIRNLEAQIPGNHAFREMKKEKAQLEKTLADATAAHTVLIQQHEQLKRENTRYMSSVEQLGIEITTLRTSLQESDDLAGNWKDRYQTLRDQHHLTTNQLQQSESDSTSYKAKLEQQLREVQGKEVAETESLRTNWEQSEVAWKTKYEGLVSSSEAIRAELDQLIRDSAAYKSSRETHIVELGNEIENLRQNLQQAEEWNAGWSSSCDTLTAEKATIEDELSQLKIDAATYKASTEQTLHELQVLQTKQTQETQALRKAFQESEEGSRQSRSDCEALMSKLGSTEAELEQLKSDSASYQTLAEQQNRNLQTEKSRETQALQVALQKSEDGYKRLRHDYEALMSQSVSTNTEFEQLKSDSSSYKTLSEEHIHDLQTKAEQETQALRKSLQECEEALRGWRSDYEALKAQMHSTKHELEQLKCDSGIYKTSAEQQIHDLQTKETQEEQTLRTSLEESENDAALWRDRFNTLSSEHQATKSELDQLKKDASTHTSSTEQRIHDLESAQKQETECLRRDWQQSDQSWTLKYDTLRSHHEVMKLELDQLNKDASTRLSSAEDTIRKLQGEKTQEKNNLEERLRTSEKDISDWKIRYHALTHDHETMKLELEQLRSDAVDHRARTEGLQAADSAGQEELQNLRLSLQQSQAIRSELETSQENFRQLEAEFNTLKNKHEAPLANPAAALQELEGTIAELEKKLYTYDSEKHRLNSQLAEASQLAEDRLVELRNLEANMQQVCEERNELKTKSNNSSSSSRIEELEVELQKERVTRGRDYVSKIRHNNLTDAYEQLKISLQEQHSSFSSLRTLNSDLRKEVQACRDQITNLKRNPPAIITGADLPSVKHNLQSDNTCSQQDIYDTSSTAEFLAQHRSPFFSSNAPFPNSQGPNPSSSAGAYFQNGPSFGCHPSGPMFGQQASSSWNALAGECPALSHCHGSNKGGFPESYTTNHQNHFGQQSEATYIHNSSIPTRNNSGGSSPQHQHDQSNSRPSSNNLNSNSPHHPHTNAFHRSSVTPAHQAASEFMASRFRHTLASANVGGQLRQSYDHSQTLSVRGRLVPYPKGKPSRYIDKGKARAEFADAHPEVNLREYPGAHPDDLHRPSANPSANSGTTHPGAHPGGGPSSAFPGAHPSVNTDTAPSSFSASSAIPGAYPGTDGVEVPSPFIASNMVPPGVNPDANSGSAHSTTHPAVNHQPNPHSASSSHQDQARPHVDSIINEILDLGDNENEREGQDGTDGFDEEYSKLAGSTSNAQPSVGDPESNNSKVKAIYEHSGIKQEGWNDGEVKLEICRLGFRVIRQALDIETIHAAIMHEGISTLRLEQFAANPGTFSPGLVHTALDLTDCSSTEAIMSQPWNRALIHMLARHCRDIVHLCPDKARFGSKFIEWLDLIKDRIYRFALAIVKAQPLHEHENKESIKRRLIREYTRRKEINTRNRSRHVKLKARSEVCAVMLRHSRIKNLPQEIEYWDQNLRILDHGGADLMSEDEDGEKIIQVGSRRKSVRVKRTPILYPRNPVLARIFMDIDAVPETETQLFLQTGKRKLERVRVADVSYRGLGPNVSVSMYRKEYLDSLQHFQLEELKFDPRLIPIFERHNSLVVEPDIGY